MLDRLQPFITVLLPVYNCEKYIAEAIDSILQQTYTHFELLIIDDCSTDATLQICKSFQDERIVIIEKEKNSGYTNSLNYGIGIAKGKYIARMDGDDISLPTRFEKQVAFLESNEDVILCGTAFSIMGSNKSIAVPEFHENIKGKLLFGNCIGHPTVMLRKSTLINNSILYDIEMEPAEDYDMWSRLIDLGILYNIQEPLLLYRVHNNQVSSIRNAIQKQKTTAIKIKLLQKINIIFTEDELNAYKKIIELTHDVTIDNFKSYAQLKERCLLTNNAVFFDIALLKDHFFKLEKRFISKNFKNNTSYNLALFSNYLKMSKFTKAKLSPAQTVKFFIKCLIIHKVK